MIKVLLAIIILFFIPVSNVGNEYYDVCKSDEYSSVLHCKTNEYRKSIGLSELKNNPEAKEVAKARSKYLCESNTFSHDSWETFLTLSYKKAGENLAKNYPTSEEALTALLNSPLHKENIEGNWESLGIYTENCNGKNITTQIFTQD